MVSSDWLWPSLWLMDWIHLVWILIYTLIYFHWVCFGSVSEKTLTNGKKSILHSDFRLNVPLRGNCSTLTLRPLTALSFFFFGKDERNVWRHIISCSLGNKCSLISLLSDTQCCWCARLHHFFLLLVHVDCIKTPAQPLFMLPHCSV